MESIKIRDFKGLVTNIDTKDANPEYLHESKNIIFRPGLVKTAFFSLEDFTGLKTTGEIMWYGKIYLDDDKFAVDIDFKPIYSEQTELYELLIERLDTPDHNEYKFYLKYPNTDYFLEMPDRWSLFKDYSKSTQEITVLNLDGIVKIFLPHDNLWLGKINRVYRTGQREENNIIIDRLVESFETIEKRINVDFKTLIITSDTVPIESVKGKFIISDVSIEGTNFFINNNSNVFNGNSTFNLGKVYWCKFIDVNGVPIINYGRLAHGDYHFLETDNHKWTDTDFALIEMKDPTNPSPTIYGFREDFYYGTSDNKGTEYIIMDSDMYTGPIAINGDQTFYIFAIHDMYIDNNQFTKGYDNFRFTSGKTLENAGFENIYGYAEIVATIFMDQTEFVVNYSKIPLIGLPNKFALKLYDIEPLVTMSKRITGIAFYLRLQNQIDFEQFSFINAQSKTDIDFSEIYLNAETPNGIYLLQMIGIIFDPIRHRLLKGFQDYKEVSGVGYAVKSNKIYFPAIGNGIVLNDVFYPTFNIPGFYSERIIKLTDIGKYLGVHTSRGLQIVIASDSRTGSFLFSIKDSAGYVAENRDSIVEAFDGVIMLTKRGIFVTNGSQDIPISKEIDDIIEATYQNGMIHIDEVNKYLYYFIKGQNIVYMFDYLEKKWTELYMPTSSITKIFEGKNNERFFLVRGILQKLVSINNGTGYISTHLINLQEPNIMKVIERITLDFIGEVKISLIDIYGKVKEYRKQSANRITTKFDFNLDQRIPNESFEIAITLINSTTLYLIQIDYDIIGETSSEMEIVDEHFI